MFTVRRVVLVVGIVIGGWGSVVVGQEVPRYVSPEELVSLNRTIPFDEALVVLNDLSRRFAQKVIVDRERHTDAIGVEIRSLPWRRALVQILKAHGLEYEEYADYIDIITPQEEKPKEGEAKATLDTREVNIAAVFFEGERRALSEVGVNWAAIREGKTRINAAQVTTSGEGDNVFSTTIARQLSSTLDITALLKTFESRNIGEIIANPQITVISGQQGRIQVGQDFSIKTRDFAGNVTDDFFSTGVILEVIPTVITQDDLYFIHLEVQVQRSSAIPGAVSTVINKTDANTSALLKDGETTVIAGLYQNDKVTIRRGIPFVRNLPWWVFGIRYLTGYNQRDIKKKELIIFIQTRIVPSLRERIAAEQETMQEMFERERQEFQRIQQGVQGAREPGNGKRERGEGGVGNF